MDHKLKSVALHITNECSCKCPFCYYIKDGQIKCEGNLETLKKIAIELKKYGVEEINLVGGDPAEYSHIQELVEFLHNLGFRIPILSNTHDYKNTSIEKITPYVTSLEGTFHGSDALAHDNINRTEGSFLKMVNNLKIYNTIRTREQLLGAVLNVMPHNYNRLYEIINRLLDQGLSFDYVLIQRIGLYGKASDNEKLILLREMLVEAFKQINDINEKLGIETVMVDAFPLCLIPKEYHKYLAKCDWGYHTASLDMSGNITRCAVATHDKENLLGNILEKPLSEIWETSPTLIKFRSKDYLPLECQKCETLNQCGGGCPESYGNNILSSDILLKTRKI